VVGGAAAAPDRAAAPVEELQADAALARDGVQRACALKSSHVLVSIPPSLFESE
jgi:hypothetical protein